ncbi:hypothetical protein ACHHYP_03231 [Achlya hypogyna]|uniref:Copper transport protein n=1 Tax=Achlya hypogyna TaxID=1202772 RepID=A0A1V9Z435_ACHHY|nr:hypothetical protein ACHHYP_03231 [Achlya hypogyna]
MSLRRLVAAAGACLLMAMPGADAHGAHAHAHAHAAGVNDDKRCPSCNMVAKDANFTWYTELNHGQKIYTCAMNTGLDYKEGEKAFSHPALVGATLHDLANSTTTCSNACPECDDPSTVVKDPNSGAVVTSASFSYICLKRGQKIYFTSDANKQVFLLGLAASPYFGVQNMSCGGAVCPDQYQVPPASVPAVTTAPSTPATAALVTDSEPFCTGASVMFSGFQTTVHGTCVKLFFQPWVLNSGVKYAFGFLGVFALPLLNEYLVRTRERLRQQLRKRAGNKRLHKLVLTVLYMMQMTLAYLAMLVVMIYDTGLFIALIFGFGAGFLFFKVDKQTAAAATGDMAAPWRFQDFKSLSILHAPGMMCLANCGATVTRALEAADGVHRVYVDIADKCIYVSGGTPGKVLVETLENVGFEATLLHEPVRISGEP